MNNVPVDVTGVVLETPRLLLRPWRPEDAQDLYAYASVDGVGQMAGWTPHTSLEESRRIVERFISEKRTFALELRQTHRVIGSLGLERIGADLGQPYSDLPGREIGYVLSKDYWGQGLMPEAVRAALDYCFSTLGCTFVQCSHFPDNHQSRRVIEKCGFTYISTMVLPTPTGGRTLRVYVRMRPETL